MHDDRVTVTMDYSLERVIDAFSAGLLAIDKCGVAHKTFRPGVEPYGEAVAVRRAVQHMREKNAKLFGEIRTKRLPNILIPAAWALEVKRSTLDDNRTPICRRQPTLANLRPCPALRPQSHPA